MISDLFVSLLYILHKCEYEQKKDARGISGIINRIGVKREIETGLKEIGLKVLPLMKESLLYGMGKDHKIPIIHC
jgi:hypothetical protein